MILATAEVITATLRAISATTKANDSPVLLLEANSKYLLNMQAISLVLVALRTSRQFLELHDDFLRPTIGPELSRVFLWCFRQISNELVVLDLQ